MLRLIRKDLRQHALPFLFYITVVGVFPMVLAVIDGGHPGVGLVSTSFIMVLLSPIMIAHWLVDTEKTKRTMFLIRTLPLSAHAVAGAKEIVAALMVTGLALIHAASSMLTLRMAGADLGNLILSVAFFWSVVGMLVFTQVMLLSFAALDQRVAIQLPYGALLVLLISVALFRRYRSVEISALVDYLRTLKYALVIFLSSIAIGIGLHLLIVRIIERTDWSRPTAG